MTLRTALPPWSRSRRFCDIRPPSTRSRNTFWPPMERLSRAVIFGPESRRLSANGGRLREADGGCRREAYACVSYYSAIPSHSSIPITVGDLERGARIFG
jgi:hypothetical protein